MNGLQKATLAEIDATANPKVTREIPVQFNPASLKLTMGNVIEGGKTAGRQTRQFVGKSSTELSFELVFDTADEGDTLTARSVRERTADIEKFVVPKRQGTNADKELPIKVRFHWGDLTIDGIISSLAIDFDLFSSGGVPLRAKMQITIKEQDARYQFLDVGPGANTGGNAPVPGAAPAGAPGTTGAGPTNRTGVALDGESAADFAQRMGVDPAAWRGIAAGLDASLSLQAGLEIDFDAGLSLGAGLGATAGLSFGVSASLETSFGLDVGGVGRSTLGGGVDPGFAAGLALSAAGGVAAATQTVANVKTTAAADAARRAFGATTSARPSATTSGAGLPVRPTAPAQDRGPLRTSFVPAAAERRVLPSAPPPPAVDARAATFGFGVPLRPRVGAAVVSVVPTAPSRARNPIARASCRKARPCHCGCGGAS